MRRIAGLALAMFVVGAVLAPGVAAGGGCHPPMRDAVTTSNETLVGIGQCSFEANVTYIEPGQKVTWMNKDAVPHTVTGVNLTWGDETYLNERDRISFSFKEEGIFPYYCVVHPGMVGAVVVGDGGGSGAASGAGSIEEVDLSAAGAAPASDAKEDEMSTASMVAIGALLVAFVLSIAFAQRSRKRALQEDAPITS